MRLFVTAIGTDSGKTLISSILCQATGYDYWKPIQAGNETDSNTVRSLVTNPNTKVLTEGVVFETPMSPHAAAELEGVAFELDQITFPDQDDLIIEGAGGLLVPINEEETLADVIERSNAEIILVSDLYLGSINHTLLTISECKRRGLKIKGIVFNGPETPSSETLIIQKTGVPVLFRIPSLEEVTPEVVAEWGLKVKDQIID